MYARKVACLQNLFRGKLFYPGNKKEIKTQKLTISETEGRLFQVNFGSSSCLPTVNMLCRFLIVSMAEKARRRDVPK